MDFNFSKAQQMLKKTVADFSENRVKPRAEEIDKSGKFPKDLFLEMTKMGLTGIGTDEKYGGSGGSDIEKIIAVEEIAKHCASTAATLSIHTIFASVLDKFGTEEQKQKYLPDVCSGGELGAFALTEPNAGSDAGSARTTAIYDESKEEYVLNGTKCFITGGGLAKYVLVFALTSPELKTKGLSCILVERGTPGFSIGKIEDKMGLHGSETVELIFDNCRVPKGNLIGQPGKGFKIAMTALDNLAGRFLRCRGLQWYLAEMATKVECARWMTYRAASLKVSGLPHTKEAAIAKFNASKTAVEVTDKALQIHGGYGYMREYPLERMYRDAKITEIYEGTSEIHKVVIAREVLK